jgi:hypothetical protein
MAQPFQIGDSVQTTRPRLISYAAAAGRFARCTLLANSMMSVLIPKSCRGWCIGGIWRPKRQRSSPSVKPEQPRPAWAGLHNTCCAHFRSSHHRCFAILSRLRVSWEQLFREYIGSSPKLLT